MRYENRRSVAQPEPTPIGSIDKPVLTPTPRVILHSAPGQPSEVYHAGGEGGFAAWSGDPGWREEDGMLVSSGMAPDSAVAFTFAPATTELLSDFAVVVEIRSTGAGSNGFGLAIEVRT